MAAETNSPKLPSLTNSLIQQTSGSLMFAVHLAIGLGNRTWQTESLIQCLLMKGIKEGI